MLSRFSAALAFVALLTAFAVPAQAISFSNTFVFGDSLSDSGNFAGIAPGFCPPLPYDGCRFSNGPVWSENLAADLGLAAAPSSLGGTNYALGGATSADILTLQVPAFDASVGGVADTSALYIVWGGGNDFLGALDPIVAADNIIDSILALSVLGANDFLVPNLPVDDPFAVAFNAALAAGLSGLVGLDVVAFDVLALLTDVTLNPAAYGLTNAVDPCFDGVSACANPDEYLLWDTVHPTAAAHVIIGDAALAALPEAGTAVLLALGLALMASLQRRAA